MQEAAKATLEALVEKHLSSLIRESVSVQRHAKRARFHQVSTDDPEKEGILRRRLHAEDINLSLQWRGSEKLYATGTTVPTAQDTTRKVDLNAYVKSENLIKPPSELGLTMHWLAVDGEQPHIIQNPTADDSVAHLIERDDLERQSPEGVRVKQLLPRLLSEELQLYFTRITMAIEQGGATPEDRQQQDAALARVSTDAGLQELVPFFVQYLSKHLFQHVGNSDNCRTLIRLARSLLLNPMLHLELHLHQLLPALITCVVAKRLSSKPFENHWALRQEAAYVLVQVCELFGEEYATLKSRVLKTMCEATADDKPLETCFGGIVAISMFGPKAVDAFLLPRAIPYIQKWDDALSKTVDLEERFAIQQCQQALLNGLGIILNRMSSRDQAERVSAEELAEAFGERLVPLKSEVPEYACCFV